MNKKIIVGIAALVFIAFWWMEIRPVTARQNCYDLAVESDGMDKDETNLFKIGRRYEAWLPAYNACLKNKGV